MPVYAVTEKTSVQYTATLKDETGAAVPLAALGTLTLTLYNVSSGAILNGRNAQNVLNANGVTVHATSGLLTWTLDPLDSPILDDTLNEELHRALFRATWSTTKGANWEVDFLVNNLAKVT